MARDRIGVGWKRSYDQGRKTYIAGSLDLGVLGNLPFAVFENDGRDEARRQPTHNLVVMASKTEESSEKLRIYMGAGWERTTQNGQSSYLSVKLELAKLGMLGLPGVDFAGVTEPIYARLVSVKSDGDGHPDHVLYRVNPEPEPAEAVPAAETTPGAETAAAADED